MNLNLKLKINEFLDNNTIINKNDFLNQITIIYDTLNPKRKPTLYNIYMKEQMAKMKEDTENKLTAKEKFTLIAKQWKEKNNPETEIKKYGKTPRKALSVKKPMI